MKSGIYLIINVINHKEYVGSSQNLKKRHYDHWYYLKRQEHKNTHLQNAWNVYGKDSFCFVILEHCLIEDLVERESWWIGLLDTMNPDKGYNLRSADRQIFSLEVKAKISAALRGDKNPMKNPETVAKMAESKRGKKLSAEHIRSISYGLKGRHHSPETKAKISAALIGNQNRTIGE